MAMGRATRLRPGLDPRDVDDVRSFVSGAVDASLRARTRDQHSADRHLGRGARTAAPNAAGWACAHRGPRLEGSGRARNRRGGRTDGQRHLRDGAVVSRRTRGTSRGPASTARRASPRTTRDEHGSALFGHGRSTAGTGATATTASRRRRGRKKESPSGRSARRCLGNPGRSASDAGAGRAYRERGRGSPDDVGAEYHRANCGDEVFKGRAWQLGGENSLKLRSRPGSGPEYRSFGAIVVEGIADLVRLTGTVA